MKIQRREKIYIAALVLLVIAFAFPYAQSAWTSPAKLAERVDVSDKGRLEWDTLRLGAAQKQAEAELLTLQANEKLNAIKQEILGENAESYEPRIDPQTGKLYFALKQKKE